MNTPISVPGPSAADRPGASVRAAEPALHRAQEFHAHLAHSAPSAQGAAGAQPPNQAGAAHPQTERVHHWSVIGTSLESPGAHAIVASAHSIPHRGEKIEDIQHTTNKASADGQKAKDLLRGNGTIVW